MHLTKTARTLFLSAAAIGAALFSSSCWSVKLDDAGEMVAVYQFQEYRMLVNSTAPKTAKAAKAAIAKFDLYLTKEEGNSHEARLEARARDDRKVIVRITETNSMQTTVGIRFGSSGNLKESQRLFDEIEANLK